MHDSTVPRASCRASMARTMTTPERRAYARSKLTGSVTFHVDGGEPRNAVLRDVGRGGAFFSTPSLCAVGDDIEFEFRLPAGKTVTGKGRVAWARDTNTPDAPAGLGVTFGDVDADSLTAIGRLVSTQVAPRARASTVIGVAPPSITTEHVMPEPPIEPTVPEAVRDKDLSWTAEAPLPSATPGSVMGEAAPEPAPVTPTVANAEPVAAVAVAPLEVAPVVAAPRAPESKPVWPLPPAFSPPEAKPPIVNQTRRIAAAMLASFIAGSLVTLAIIGGGAKPSGSAQTITLDAPSARQDAVVDEGEQEDALTPAPPPLVHDATVSADSSVKDAGHDSGKDAGLDAGHDAGHDAGKSKDAGKPKPKK